MTLIQQLERLIREHLKEYLSTLYQHSIYLTDGNTIHVDGKKNKEDLSGFTLFKLVVRIEHEEFLIPNIYIPKEDRRNGIGLGLIAFIFEIGQQINFNLALSQMTDSFREKMLQRGAIETNVYDCLLIIESTNLKSP